jgi:hypothetical protein
MTMQDQEIANPARHRRVPWNKGKLTFDKVMKYSPIQKSGTIRLANGCPRR